MDAIVNFFTLRPTFTIFGLKLPGTIYLLNVVVQIYNSIVGYPQCLAQRGMQLDHLVSSFMPVFLGWIAQLVIVRLLLEVAAISFRTHLAPNAIDNRAEYWPCPLGKTIEQRGNTMLPQCPHQALEVVTLSKKSWAKRDLSRK